MKKNDIQDPRARIHVCDVCSDWRHGRGTRGSQFRPLCRACGNEDSECRLRNHRGRDERHVQVGRRGNSSGPAAVLPRRRPRDAAARLEHRLRGLAAARKLEWPVRAGRERRARRRHLLSRARGHAAPRLCDGGDGQRPRGEPRRRPLGHRPAGESRGLRVSRSARDARHRGRDHGALLRQGAEAALFLRLLAGRARGACRGAAFPGGFRRHRRGLAGERLDQPAVRIRLGVAGGARETRIVHSGSEAPGDPESRDRGLR